MGFSTCSDCGDGVLLVLAFVWCVPALVYAIRHQRAADPVAVRFLGVVQHALVAAATVFSLWLFGLLGASHPLFRLIVVFVVAASACVAAVGLLRRPRR